MNRAIHYLLLATALFFLTKLPIELLLLLAWVLLLIYDKHRGARQW